MLSSPLQPGQAFFCLPYAMQRLQFIPQTAIRAVGIELVFIDLLRFILKYSYGSYDNLCIEAQRSLSMAAKKIYGLHSRQEVIAK